MDLLVIAPVTLVVLLATLLISELLRKMSFLPLVVRRHAGRVSALNALGLFIILYIGGTFLAKVLVIFLPNFGETVNTLLSILLTALILWVILRKWGDQALED